MNEACFVLISYCLMGFGSDKGAVQSLTMAQICSGRVGKAVGLQIPSFFFFLKKSFFTFQLKS